MFISWTGNGVLYNLTVVDWAIITIYYYFIADQYGVSPVATTNVY